MVQPAGQNSIRNFALRCGEIIVTSNDIGPFLAVILAAYPEWEKFPLVERIGDGWQGIALTIEPPEGSDIDFGLDIEEVGNEVTISFDYAHLHMQWPPVYQEAVDPIWWDAQMLIAAILADRIVASSGWIDGELRAGSLHPSEAPVELLVPALEHIRVRSWEGTFSRDEGIVQLQHP
jgi:hypothetical protein